MNNAQAKQIEYITWRELAEHIDQMTEDEKDSEVLIWATDENLSNTVTLYINDEDIVYDPNKSNTECMDRSEWDQDNPPEIALEAGRTYLLNEKKYLD